MASSSLDILIKAKDEAAAVFRSLSSELSNMHGHATNVQGSMRGAAGSTEQAGVAAAGGGMSFGKLAGAFALAQVGVQALEGGIRVGIDVVEKIAQAAENSVNSFTDFGVSIKTLQTEFGLSAESASVLTDMFKRFDDITGASENSLGLFAKNINSASEGSGAAAKTFERLGIAVTDSSGHLRQLDDILPQVASALSKETDGTQKAADAKALFGRAGLNLIPMLQQLATQGLGPTTEEFKSMGLVMDQAGVDKAYNLKMGMIGVKEQVQGLGIQIGSALAPVVQNLIDDLQVWVIRQGGVTGVMRELAPILQGAVVGFGGFIKILGEGAEIMGKVGIGLSYLAEAALFVTQPWLALSPAIRNVFSDMRSGAKDLENMGSSVKQLGEDVQNYGTNMFKDMSSTIQGQLRNLPSVVGGAFQTAGLEAKLATGESVASILAEYKDLPPDVQAYLLSLPQAVSLNIKAATPMAEGAAAQTVAGVTHAFASLPQDVQQAIAALPPDVRQKLSDTAAVSGPEAAKMVLNYLNQANTLTPKTAQELQDLASKGVTPPLSQAASQASIQGNQTASNWNAGVSLMHPATATVMTQVSGAVTVGTGQAADNAAQGGANIAQNLQVGVAPAADNVSVSMAPVNTAVQTATGDAAQTAQTGGVSIASNLQQGITDKGPAKVPAPDFSAVTDSYGVAQAVGRAVASNVQTGIDAQGPAHIPAPVQDHAGGGVVSGFASGGPVYLQGGGDWGSPRGTDTVRAWLTPGEYVMRREAVARIGAANLDAMNNDTAGGGSARGGTVINQTNNNYSNFDLEVANRELGWQLAMA